MGDHANVISYFFQAGFVVKSVMMILLAASVTSWTLIFQRAWYFKRTQRQFADFTQRFWEAGDLNTLYADVSRDDDSKSGLGAMFTAGFHEFLRARKQGPVKLGSIERAMEICHAKESLILQQHLSLLASIGSIAPFIGLFGTVWGIMTSFHALGQATQATIAMVAPGISEALVATALGLFTAIPAVIAYNRYTTRANDLSDRYDLFQEEFIAIIEQQTSAPARIIQEPELEMAN